MNENMITLTESKMRKYLQLIWGLGAAFAYDTLGLLRTMNKNDKLFFLDRNFEDDKSFEDVFNDIMDKIIKEQEIVMPKPEVEEDEKLEKENINTIILGKEFDEPKAELRYKDMVISIPYTLMTGIYKYFNIDEYLDIDVDYPYFKDLRRFESFIHKIIIKMEEDKVREDKEDKGV